MICPVFRGKVNEQGVLQVDARFDAWLSTLKGLDVDVIVRKPRKPRSNQQNRYFHGVVVKMLTDDLWGDGDYEGMKRALAEMLLSTVDEKHGLKRIKSTTELSTVEWEDYMVKCRHFGDTMHICIPLPNEVDY